MCTSERGVARPHGRPEHVPPGRSGLRVAGMMGGRSQQEEELFEGSAGASCTDTFEEGGSSQALGGRAA